MELGAAFAGGADQGDGKALIEGHRDERRLAEAGDSLDPDFLRIDRSIALEVIEATTRPPGPCTERAPIIRLTRLGFVHESDDSLPQPSAVVCLNAAGSDDGVAPP